MSRSQIDIHLRSAVRCSEDLLAGTACALGCDLIVRDPSGLEVARFSGGAAEDAGAKRFPIESSGEEIGTLEAAGDDPRSQSLMESLARDVGERYQSERDLDQMTDQLGDCYDEINLLYRFKRILEPGKRFAATAPLLLKEVAGLLDQRHLVVFQDEDDFVASNSEDLSGSKNTQAWLASSRGVLRQIYRGMRGAVPDSPSAQGSRHAGSVGTPQGELSYVVVPLRSRESPVGFVGLFRTKEEPAFETGELRLMECLADELSAAATTRRLYDELQEMLFNTVRGMVAAIDAKDEYTRGHSERVYKISVRLGRRMGLSEEEMQVLSWAALLHDIGKIAVAGSILNKPGKLTDEEFQIIKSHPERGCRVLEPIPQLKPAVPAIRAHHERFDGRGYPQGLKGEEIPLAARIIAVADTFDAIVSTRAYRKARGMGLAVAEIGRCSGSQFDPRVVRAFLEMASEGGLEEAVLQEAGREAA